MNPNSPPLALRRIHALLDGKEWTAETFDAIAIILDHAGFQVGEPGEPAGLPARDRDILDLTDVYRLVTDGLSAEPDLRWGGSPDGTLIDVSSVRTKQHFTITLNPDGFPLDDDGNPLAWPDPEYPDEYVDAWNGSYGSRVEALAEARHWVARVAERRLAFGESLQTSD